MCVFKGRAGGGGGGGGVGLDSFLQVFFVLYGKEDKYLETPEE